jgi:hypothetical protein
MNKLKYIILFVLILALNSCESELNEDEDLVNYFLGDNLGKGITITNLSIIKYDTYPTIRDTLLVKFIVQYSLSDKLFNENNIKKPKSKITAELYVNEIEYPLLFEGSTKDIYIYKGFSLFKNRVNEIKFKYIMLERGYERIIGSNTYLFRVN